jgi:cystathionine beta-lyase/cystathionine gamma-synthase
MVTNIVSPQSFAVTNNFLNKINDIDLTINRVKASGVNSVIDATHISFPYQTHFRQ